MSKLTKILSTGYDILMGIDQTIGEQERNNSYDLERVCNIIHWLEGLCDHEKLYYTPRCVREETGSLQVYVRDETGQGVPAQVKLFPISTGKNEHINNTKNELNFQREITGWEGELKLILPIGVYSVEISKGSEYTIIRHEIRINKDKASQLTIELVPILHLRRENWYSGDLHHHSIYSSPVYGGTDPVLEGPKTVCRSMMAMGASFGALSDHHNILNHPEWAALQNDKFIPILSKEISTSNGHVMSLGAAKDVIYHIPDGKNRTEEYLRKEFIRITEEIKGLGGLPQINHPRDRSKAISWNEEYDDILQIFETMELWNGSNPMLEGTANHRAFLLWLKLLEEGRYIPATAGSDTHNILANDYHAYFNQLSWLAELITQKRLPIPKELTQEVASYIRFYKEVMPALKKWAENLTSACVRNYVHVTGEVTQSTLLSSLKQGHSFLTNGPILIPEISGKLPGETLAPKPDKTDISIKLLANRPLKQLLIYSNGNRRTDLSLETRDQMQGSYDYSRILCDISLKDIKWMFFIAKDDCNNMAITNPIFFE